LRKERTTALGETTAAAVLWGTSFPIINYGIGLGLDPRLFVFLRFAMAAPMMVIIAGLLGRRMLPTLKMKAVWLLGLLNAVGYLCQFIGQSMTDASVAALLVNLSFMVTAVGSAAFLKERFGAAKSLGVLLAILGTVLLTTQGNLSVVTRGQLVGDLLYLVAAFCWGCYLIYNKQCSGRPGWDTISVPASIVALTAVFVSPVLLTLGVPAPPSIVSWEVIAYTAVFNTALPFVLYQRGLMFLSATTSAIVLMLEIVSALVISVVFLGEALGGLSLAGAASILVSIYLVSRTPVGSKSLSVLQTNG
jgi:drug/metabolite transporter (DMT)-like permease